VNTTTPYENLIAAKLDQMPVPDMADSIWNSIEMQLDADAVDEAPDKKTTPKNTGKGWYGFMGAMVVATSLWWYYHDGGEVPQQTTPIKTIPVIEKPAIVTDSQTIIHHKPAEKKILIVPAATQKDSFSLNNLLPGAPLVDSGATQDMDSSFLQTDKNPVRVFDSVYTFPIRKKYRGVKGITQDDYKLSVNQDSIQKK